MVVPATHRERRIGLDDPLQGRIARLGRMASPSAKRAIGYPTNRLLGVIDDPSEAAAALADLKAAGLSDRDLEILRGEEGADRMDGTGEVSGWLGRLRRAFDFTLMDQLVDFAAYERALRDGRAVVMVHVHGDAPKEQAHQILKRHGGHFINYYGRFATEEMDLWRGPEPDIPGYLRR
jgi:hypothetical protein